MIADFVKKIGVVSVIALTLAGCLRSTPAERAERVVEKINSELNLNQEQLDHLKALKTELVLVQQRLEADRSNNFYPLFEEDQFNEEKALALVDTEMQRYREIATHLLPRVTEFYNALDINQKNQLKEFMQAHNRVSKRHGVFGERGFYGRS